MCNIMIKSKNLLLILFMHQILITFPRKLMLFSKKTIQTIGQDVQSVLSKTINTYTMPDMAWLILKTILKSTPIQYSV